MPKLRPLSDKVLVKRAKPEEKSKGGIILADNARQQQATGEVLAVGPGRLTEKGDRLQMSVCPGNVVTFPQYAGHAVQINGEDLLLMTESDILGILE